MGRHRINIVRFPGRSLRSHRRIRPTRQQRPLRQTYRPDVTKGGFLLGVLIVTAMAMFQQVEQRWNTPTESAIVRPSQIGSKSPNVVGVPRSSPLNKTTVTGRASVIDGDTIEIHGERIRLNGIDAPESAQLCKNGQGGDYRCGAEAAAKLADVLAKSRPATCEFIERDAYDRMVAVCYRADGVNVAALMVSAGHALDWPRYSGGAYAAEQQQAKEKKLGMWRGRFTEPWQWRSEQRARQAPSSKTPTMLLGAKQTSSTGCHIKGNISNKGERIYHMPGQRYYDRTRIDPAKGERMFCSEAEARATGWRRSKV